MKRPYQISLAASFCVLLLVFFATTPSGAQASKQAYATIQYVNTAISKALSPVQISINTLSGRVTNLEATVTPIPGQIANLQNHQTQVDQSIKDLQTTQSSQASQINNLQNAPSKALRIFDANDHELGISDGDTPFNTNLNKLIPISANGLAGETVSAWYTTTDCSGTTYITPVNEFDPSLYIYNVGGVHMEVDTTVPVINTLNILSARLPSNCQAIIGSLQEHNVFTLKQVASPYQEPIPLPLKIKYQ